MNHAASDSVCKVARKYTVFLSFLFFLERKQNQNDKNAKHRSMSEARFGSQKEKDSKNSSNNNVNRLE